MFLYYTIKFSSFFGYLDVYNEYFVILVILAFFKDVY